MFKVIDFFGFGMFFQKAIKLFIMDVIAQSSLLMVPVLDLIWAVKSTVRLGFASRAV